MFHVHCCGTAWRFTLASFGRACLVRQLTVSLPVLVVVRLSSARRGCHAAHMYGCFGGGVDHCRLLWTTVVGSPFGIPLSSFLVSSSLVFCVSSYIYARCYDCCWLYDHLRICSLYSRKGCGPITPFRPITSTTLTIDLLPPDYETLSIASIPHIVALEVELPHGW